MQLNDGIISFEVNKMYLYVLDQKSFNKLNKENNTVIIGVYEENCTISMLFKGMMRQLRKVMSRDIIFGTLQVLNRSSHG